MSNRDDGLGSQRRYYERSVVIGGRPGCRTKLALSMRRWRMTNRFHLLIESLAATVEQDYLEARKHARDHDPQRAGHEGESTWQHLLNHWGPGLPVVTRKYIVGPEGETNEVDVIMLKPDYPPHLREQPSVLISGVAAAFSSKLTLRREHIAEALDQKKRIIEVGGKPERSVKETLCGTFPFGLLSHSTELLSKSENFGDDMKRLYDQVAHHRADEANVAHPREELDALLVADKAFFSTHRASRMPPNANVQAEWGPASIFMGHPDAEDLQGAPLAQFITWLSSQCSPDPRGSSLEALKSMFGADRSNGYQTPWPMTIYPEHVRNNLPMLLNEFGNTKFF